MYPKYVFNLDEVHKWHNIDISLNKLYNQALRQQGITSPLKQSIASHQRPQEAVISCPPMVWQSCHEQQDSYQRASLLPGKLMKV